MTNNNTTTRITIDTHCHNCGHSWADHYKAGCYFVMNNKISDEDGLPIRYCDCVEPVNRLNEEPVERGYRV